MKTYIRGRDNRGWIRRSISNSMIGMIRTIVWPPSAFSDNMPSSFALSAVFPLALSSIMTEIVAAVTLDLAHISA